MSIKNLTDDELQEYLDVAYTARDKRDYGTVRWTYWQNQIDRIRAEMARRDAEARAQQEAGYDA